MSARLLFEENKSSASLFGKICERWRAVGIVAQYHTRRRELAFNYLIFPRFVVGRVVAVIYENIDWPVQVSERRERISIEDFSHGTVGAR